VVEYHFAHVKPSSNPSHTKKKKKKRRRICLTIEADFPIIRSIFSNFTKLIANSFQKTKGPVVIFKLIVI
jgi:hypothetical protein